MGDNINVDWGLAPQAPTVSPSNAFMQGFQNGRTMGLQRTEDQARADALAHPSDMNALTRLSVYDPNGAKGIMSSLDFQRAAQTRQLYGDAVASMPLTNALTPQMAPQAPQMAAQPQQGALPAVAPGADFAAAMAPVGAPGTPPAQAPGAQPTPGQSSPMTDPTHGINVQIGQAAMQGQIDPNQAFAALARSDPTAFQSAVESISKLDTIQRARVSDAGSALGGAAQALLTIPTTDPNWQAKRLQLLQQIAPQLMQHGITQQQLQQAAATGLSDDYLHGNIGQALGVVGAVEQANKVIGQGQKQQEIGLDSQRVGIEQQNADSTRMTAGAQAAGTGIADGYGNIINNRTGAVMFGQGGAGGGGGAALNPEIVSYAKSKGLSDAQAQALAAVSAGEGGQLGNVNSTGGGHGAYGLFQIRDSGGLQAMKAKYGPNPSLQQQVDFYLDNNAKGATGFWNAKDSNAALSSLITDAQRAGADTPALMSRAQASLNGGRGGGGLTSDAVHDQALEGIVQHGGTPPPGTARNKGAQVAITNEISNVAKNSGYTVPQMVAWAAANKADAGSLASLEKIGSKIRASETTAQLNADMAIKLGGQVTRGNITVFNAWKNHFAQYQSDPKVAAFGVALSTFANEAANVAGGGVSSDTLRAETHSNFNMNIGQHGLEAAIGTMKQDMTNRRAGFLSERSDIINRMASTGGHPAGASHPDPVIAAGFAKYGIH